MIFALFFLGCVDARNNVSDNPALWVPVPSPPGHADAECFVWADGDNQSSYGGPACFPKGTGPICVPK